MTQQDSIWYDQYKRMCSKATGFAGIIGAFEANLEYATQTLRGKKKGIYTNKEVAKKLEEQLERLKEEFSKVNAGEVTRG